MGIGMTKKIKRFGVMSIALLIIFCVALATQVFAVTSDGKLTVNYIHENISFQAYKVADFKGGKYTLSGDFASYAVSLNNLNSNSDWLAAAGTLAGYASADLLSPNQVKTTNAGKQAVFSDLKKGVYLITGSSYVLSSKRYSPTPFLVVISNIPISVDAKYDMTPETDDTVAEYKAVKIWNDNTYTRPSAVTIKILCDEEQYKIVTLNKDNNWTYTWQGQIKSNWQVVEINVPDNYTVISTQERYVFTITNTYKEIPTEPTKPTPTSPVSPTTPSTRPEETTSTPITSVESTTQEFTTKTSETNNDKLPQTGQLRWPIPILCTSGIFLILIGIIIVRKKNDEITE